MRICFPINLVPQETCNKIKEQVRELDFDVDTILLEIKYENGIRKLINQDIDYFVFPLHLTPIKRLSAIKIWALTKRHGEQNCLLIKNDQSSNSRIPIPENGSVFVSNPIFGEQVRNLRQDITYKVISPMEIIAGIHNQQFPFAVLEKMYLSEEVKNNYRIIELSNKEFGHAPGQGTFAIIGRDNEQSGGIIRSLSHIPTGRVCNDERMLISMIGELVACHSEENQFGNHLMWIYTLVEGKIKKSHISQSTRNQLVERGVKQLHLKQK